MDSNSPFSDKPITAEWVNIAVVFGNMETDDSPVEFRISGPQGLLDVGALPIHIVDVHTHMRL